MIESSKHSDIEAYLEQITVISDTCCHVPQNEPVLDRVVSVVCSILLHALMLFVFSLSMFRAPAMVVASEPASLWLLPFLQPEESAPATAPSPQRQEDMASRVALRDDSSQDVEMPRVRQPAALPETDTPPPRVTADAEMVVVRPASTPPKSEQKQKPLPRPPAPPVPVPAAAPQPAPPPAEKAAPKTELPTSPAGTASPAAAKADPKPEPAKTAAEQPRQAEPNEPEHAAPAPVKPIMPPPAPAKAVQSEIPRREPVSQRQNPAPTRNALSPVPAAAPPPQRKPDAAGTTESVPSQPLVRMAAEQKKAADVLRPGIPAVRTAPAASPPQPVPQSAAAPKAVERKEPTRGILAPKLSGDIKVIITGTPVPDIRVSFTEFAANRRHKPLTRTESRHESTVTPLIATESAQHHLVIPQSRAGIYTVSASFSGGHATATFQLKLYEGGMREQTKKIGTFKIAERTVICKILMPEGILWDDDAAFSGTLESSDSITKFNSDTGLTWKEYR